jgi:hypothetical protein
VKVDPRNVYSLKWQLHLVLEADREPEIYALFVLARPIPRERIRNNLHHVTW